jgi:hypothetical protein
MRSKSRVLWWDMKQLSLLSDEALFQSLQTVLRAHRSCTVDLIAHLAELEARGAHLGLGFSSLFAYCVERLGFSEDEACRRIDAARLSRQFPQILALLSAGELTLTAVGLLKQHLTEENATELLAGVSKKPSRAAREWLAARFPRRDVAASIRALPRQLPAPSVAHTGLGTPSQVVHMALPESTESPRTVTPAPMTSRPRVEPLSAERFAIRLTVSRSVRDAFELARDLLRHRNPGGELEVVFELAICGLVERLERERFGRTTRPAKRRAGKRTHVTNETRRTVVGRDGLGCDFVGPDGHRCGSHAFLEFDHIDPVGSGAASQPDNIRLLCFAHNQFAAESFYGKEHVRRARQRARRTRTSNPA